MKLINGRYKGLSGEHCEDNKCSDFLVASLGGHSCSLHKLWFARAKQAIL